MEQYTTYESGVHAACVAIQVYHGIEEGLQFSKDMLDTVPLGGDCNAARLRDLLWLGGVDAHDYALDPTDVQAVVQHSFEHCQVALIEVFYAPTMRGRRWAVVQGITGLELLIGIAVGEGESPMLPKHVDEFATGQVVVCDAVLPPGRQAVAFLEKPLRHCGDGISAN